VRNFYTLWNKAFPPTDVKKKNYTKASRWNRSY